MTKTTDFFRATLRAHEEAQRQTGRTTRIALEAIQNNAVMVCHNVAFANVIEREYGHHGLKAVGLDTYLRDDYHRNRNPKQLYVFDHFVEFTMIIKKLEEVEKFLNV
jgi:hypothetical protein